jgi:hypothetical protein
MKNILRVSGNLVNTIIDSANMILSCIWGELFRSYTLILGKFFQKETGSKIMQVLHNITNSTSKKDLAIISV